MKLIRKSVSVVLSLILIISLFTILPPEAFAAAEVQYIERSWDSANQKVVDTVKTCTDYTTITSQSSLTIGSGKWYVVNGDATIDKRVTVSGTAHIILLSGTLKCMYGIRLSKGNSLFVYPGKNSEGKLNPRTGDDEEANLGGNKGEDCGEFVFYGGTLDVFNYDWCSGATAIGGGGYGGNCGKLSFYGGTVDASNNGAAPGRKSYGAVIGDGSDAYSNDSDCYINIYGGTIKADNHADSNGSGIGGGEDSTGCPINILGGKITARAYNGAGIGSGQDGGSSTVTIKNATVEAESDYGAGIGSGEDSNSKSIIIENSYVKAESKTNSGSVGAEGAGIGGGNCGKSESIKISKSIIIASSGRYGAGIGGGDESDGGNIEITDSNVFAHSAQGGAGIGGGDEKGCNSIVLKNSFVTAITDSDVNTAGENFIKDYGSYYNTIMESISNPAISEQAGFYAGGALTAMAIAYLINGNHTGAGIGSGDSGTVNSIKIDNCVVLATGGDYGAGIGGGDEGGFGTISINNSNVHAEGGKYGAGIGTGDEAEKCGTINITNSTVTAKAGTDAAGIGTGNEVDQTPTININRSTVDSRGGAYGSGIGGGDATGGGSISIRNSTVNSYGGKDAAGIGGGEGGSGGTIKIYDSNVYAEGKSCGAGIGNGEDGYSTTVMIYGDSRVEAYGGNSDTSAIGHGDNGIFYSYSINTYIDDELKVKAGSSKDSTSVYYDKTRYDAVWDHKYALVYDCEHEHTEWWGQDTGSHVLRCSDCGKWLTSRERHTWNSDDICTVCGGKRIHLTLTIKEKNRSGQTVQKEKHMDGYTAYTLPECENVPDGYEFLYWKVNDPGSIDYFYPPGERLNATWASPVVEAVYLPLKETKYIDKNGVEKTVMAKQVSALEDMEYLMLVTDGWYVIDENLDIKGTTRCYGDVKFIVEDGCTWSAERYEQSMWHRDFITSYGRGHSTFSLYGQKNQTGYIDGGYVRGASFSSYNQYGAKFHCYTAIFSESYEIFRGSFNSYDITGTDYGALLIDGGKNNFGILSGGSQGSQIGWTELTDSITFSRISCNTPIKIKEGQAFKDNYGNIYKGEITLEQQAALSEDIRIDKTLKPYLEHNYGEPEWEWANEYKDATALFKCIDDGCDDEQLVNAKVTYEDKDDIRTSTATCKLNGQTYTTTHSGRLHWKVNVENTVHGTVTADESMPKKDEVVKLNITPDEGYVLKSWSVTPDDDSQSVETKSTQFVMPECDVTVRAEFIPITPRNEPYIDENGEYHLGTVEYAEINGEPYSVNDDGTIGEMLDTVELSYFDFALINNDSEYQINYYTGPTDISELVIPKTFNGKPVTVIGDDNNSPFINYGENPKTQFELVLNENIREIKAYTFYTMWVKKVKGNSSGLNKIGDYAFSWANSPDGFEVDIKLDYEGTITVGRGIFNNMTVTARIKHATKLSRSSFMQKSISYIFTDAHTCGEPVWTWADDYSSATAKFTCTDSRCKHEETVNATVTDADELTKTVYTASAEFGGNTYTDTKESEKQCSDIIIADANHGEITADKASAYEGEKITLTPTPDDGYKLVSVNVKDTKGNDIEVSENSFIMPCSNVTVTAEFGKKQYAISYGDDYDGGFISGPLYADEGDEITVNAVSYSGYELASLSYRDGSGSYIKINENTFTMPASEVKVYASFRKANYNISYKTDGNGTITGASTAQFNDRVPITVTPNEGYVLNNLYAEDDEWRDPADIIDGCIVMYDGNITVRAEFIPITSAKEPYIDSNGEYHLGNIEYVQLGDDYYTVENGAVGSRIDSVELSYFDFTDNGSTYQINYYTGPTDNLTELVIPKTFNGKPITVLGTDNQNAFIANSNPKPRFTLTLNENIQVIKGYAFYTMWVKKVQGDTSALRSIGAYAFSWANSPDGYKLDIKLDYEGVIGVGKGIFNNMTVTARLKHATAFSSSNFMQKSITYVITDDAHSYGNPIWTWADDYSSASAKFTCTDPRCKHEETADAEIISEYENGAPKYIAAASFEGKEYTNVKALENPLDASYLPEITAATALGNDGNLFSLSDSLVYTKAKLLGVQKKETIKTDTAGSGLRFVAELSSEFVGKDNIDYGFEVVKTSKNNTAGFAGATPTGGFDIMQNLINENSGNIKSISCKNTSNNITADARYGDRSADTAYKYVTLAVNDIPDTQGVAVRFYVEIDGAKYYSAYTNSNGEAFRGCCASYETLENAVR